MISTRNIFKLLLRIFSLDSLNRKLSTHNYSKNSTTLRGLNSLRKIYQTRILYEEQCTHCLEKKNGNYCSQYPSVEKLDKILIGFLCNSYVNCESEIFFCRRDVVFLLYRKCYALA